MNKDKIKKLFSNPELKKFYAEIGAKGGESTSDKKVETARINGIKPCAQGKHRGRPLGSKDKIKRVRRKF